MSDEAAVAHAADYSAKGDLDQLHRHIGDFLEAPAAERVGHDVRLHLEYVQRGLKRASDHVVRTWD